MRRRVAFVHQHALRVRRDAARAEAGERPRQLACRKTFEYVCHCWNYNILFAARQV